MKATDYKFITSSLTFGIVVNVDTSDNESMDFISTILDPFIDKCNMPDCGEMAVRIGIYPINLLSKEKWTEFRGLCDRHKRMGIWTDAETAWGWD